MQPLNKALSDVNKTISTTSNELKTVNNMLRLDPTNVTLLAQKQKLLTDAIAATEEKLKRLKTAQEQAVKQLERGEIGEDQYRALERQVIATERSLGDYQSQLRDVERGTEQMADTTEDAEGKFKEMSTEAKVALAAVGAAVAKAGQELLSFLMDTVEGTKELRTDMAKLEQNAKSAGTTFEDVSDELDYFVAVTDQSDSSVEALSNLLQAGFTGEGLTAAVENLAGAVIKFPDTLNIESLADSIQETLATGTATGQYGELLERLGVNLEDFEAGLADCTTAAEKQEYAIDMLAKHGLAEVSAEYKDANQNLIEYSNAQQHYNEVLAEMGEAVQPAMTAFTEIKATLLEGMVPALEEAGEAIQDKMASPEMQRKIEQIGEAIGDIAVALADVLVFIIDNADIVLDVIASIGAGIAGWKIAGVITNVVNAFKSFGSAATAAGQAAATAIKTVNAASVSTIIGTVITFAGLLVTLLDSLTQADEKYQQVADDSKELRDSINDSATAFRDQQSEILAQSAVAGDLLNEIGALNSEIEQMGANDEDAAVKKAQLTDRVNKFNGVMGESVITIDEETGLINENIGTIEDQIKAIEKRAKAKAYEEYYVELARQELEADLQLAESKEALTQAIMEQTGKTKEEVEAMSDAELLRTAQNASILTTQGNLQTAATAVRDAAAADNELAKEKEMLNGLIEQEGIVFDETAASAAGYAGNVDGATESVKNLTDEEAAYLIAAQTNGQTLSEEQQAQLDAYKAANEERYNSMSELAQKEYEIQQKRIEQARNTEEQITLEMDTSLAKRTDNMLANQETIRQSQQDYEHLLQLAMDSGNIAMQQYLEQLDVTSVEGMSILRQMAEDSSDGIGEVTRDFINAWANGAYTGMGRVENAVETGADATRSTIQTEFSEGNARDDMSGLAEAGDLTMDELIDGILGARNRVRDTIDTVIMHSRSQIYGYITQADFAALGEKIDDDLARGIRRAQSAVTSAANTVANRIRSIFNFSVSVTRTGSGARIRSYDVGGYFDEPQVIEIAERRPEFVGAAQDLQSFINDSVARAFRRMQGLSEIEMPNVWGAQRAGYGGAGNAAAAGGGDVIVNIDSFVNNTDQDIETLTNRIGQSLQKQINRRNLIW